MSRLTRVLINSEAHLQSQLAGVEKKIRTLDHDWEERDAALVLVRELCVCDDMPKFRAALEQEVARLRKPLAEQLKDLRSSIVRTACSSISALAACLGAHFEAHAEFFLPHLLRLTAVTKEVIATSSNNAMRDIVQHVKSYKLMHILVDSYAAAKNKVTRMRCVEQFHNLVVALPLATETDPARLQQVDSLTHTVLEAALDDADPKVRSTATALFWFYHSVFERAADALCDSLSAARQKMVMRARPGSGSAQSKAGAGAASKRPSRRRQLKPNKAFAQAAEELVVDKENDDKEQAALTIAVPAKRPAGAMGSGAQRVAKREAEAEQAPAAAAVVHALPQRVPKKKPAPIKISMAEHSEPALAAVAPSAARSGPDMCAGARADLDHSTTGLIMRSIERIEESGCDWERQLEAFTTLKGVWERFGGTQQKLSERSLRRLLAVHVEVLRSAKPKLATSVLKSIALLAPVFRRPLAPLLLAPIESGGPVLASVLLSMLFRHAHSTSRVQAKVGLEAAHALASPGLIPHVTDLLEFALEDGDAPMVDASVEYLLTCMGGRDAAGADAALDDEDVQQVMQQLAAVLRAAGGGAGKAVDALRMLEQLTGKQFMAQLEAVGTDTLEVVSEALPELGLGGAHGGYGHAEEDSSAEADSESQARTEGTMAVAATAEEEIVILKKDEVIAEPEEEPVDEHAEADSQAEGFEHSQGDGAETQGSVDEVPASGVAEQSGGGDAEENCGEAQSVEEAPEEERSQGRAPVISPGDAQPAVAMSERDDAEEVDIGGVIAERVDSEPEQPEECGVGLQRIVEASSEDAHSQQQQDIDAIEPALRDDGAAVEDQSIEKDAPESPQAALQRVAGTLASPHTTSGELRKVLPGAIAVLAGSVEDELELPADVAATLMRALKVWGKKKSDKAVMLLLELCKVLSRTSVVAPLAKMAHVLLEIALHGSPAVQAEALAVLGAAAAHTTADELRDSLCKRLTEQTGESLLVALWAVKAVLGEMPSEELARALPALLPPLQPVLRGTKVAQRKGAVECLAEAAFRLGPEACQDAFAPLSASHRKLVSVYLRKRQRVAHH